MPCHDLTCESNRWKLRAALRDFACNLGDSRMAHMPQTPEFDRLLTELAALYVMGRCEVCAEKAAVEAIRDR